MKSQKEITHTEHVKLVTKTLCVAAKKDLDLFDRLLVELISYIHRLNNNHELVKKFRPHFAIKIGPAEEAWSEDHTTCHTTTPVTVWYAGRAVIFATEKGYWTTSRGKWSSTYSYEGNWELAAKVADIRNRAILSITKKPKEPKSF
jgi:hypothetical protein